MNTRFRKGNVIRNYGGDIEIVIKVNSDGYTNTILIDSQNCEIGRRDETYEENDNERDCDTIDCEYCENNKPHKKKVYGMDSCKLLAYTVKEWIIKSMTKDFGF